MAHPFHIVDVFAEQSYAGNPLAVVTHADDLSTETMQRIALETNYSETTFVNALPEADGGYRVRLFTPAREIAFAGHPILGTAWVIRQHVAKASGPVRLNLAVGQVPVSFERTAEGDEAAWFLAPPVTSGASCTREAMANALGIAPGDIDPACPIQMMTAGVSAMIVPIRSLDALRRCMLNLDAYAPLLAQGFPPLIYLFCRETHHPQNDLCVRFFFEAHGVREDPATGNGAAFLARYLRLHDVYPPEKLTWRIEQGQEVRRPSLVQIRVRIAPDPTIHIGGGVVAAIQGNLIQG